MVTAARPQEYLTPAIMETTWTSEEWAGMVQQQECEGFLMYGPDGEPYVGVVEPETDPDFPRHYNARIVGLPGCVSYATDIETAKQNLREALELYFE